MRVNKENIIDNISMDVAGLAVITTGEIDLQHAWGYSVYAKWTKTGVGVLAGTFVVQKSVDGINWIAMSSDAIGNASSHAEQEKTDVTYAYARVVVTLTGGTADVLVTTFTKGS